MFIWLSNTLKPRQNGRHFVDDIFNCIFLNENVWILIKISLKFVPKGSINNIPALVQIMAWRRPGSKLLSKPMMVSSLTHICVTRPQWVKVVCLTLYISIIFLLFTVSYVFHIIDIRILPMQRGSHLCPDICTVYIINRLSVLREIVWCYTLPMLSVGEYTLALYLEKAVISNNW